MTKTCIEKLLKAGWKLVRTDRHLNSIKEYKEVQNPDPQSGRGGYSWQRIQGPFGSWAATERRFQEMLEEEPKTIQG
jgi:hypothetical protein